MTEKKYKLNDPNLMTTADVAAYFKVHPLTVRRWIKTGKINYILFVGDHPNNNRIRFRPEDVRQRETDRVKQAVLIRTEKE